MKHKLVMPGDQLSTSEELMPGDGTFEENGIIRAARIGTYVVDEKHRTAEVKPATSTPVILKKGDIVIGRVVMAKEKMIIVEVKHVAGKNRSISSDTDATIHVKEIAQGFIKEASSEYKAEDYIRAKVIQVSPSVQLETKERNFGAIKALCSKCRHPLVKKSQGLECENCGNKEYRRIAEDYGNLDIEHL
ncbi:MAG: exosome complex RNA-binding protein Csl4 [Euryarchaeota archaeon]|jgi:exosome complex component CSL4|nr:exosome complex RNA-binding protein Csl4 [Euryarchaeota archaeon]